MSTKMEVSPLLAVGAVVAGLGAFVYTRWNPVGAVEDTRREEIDHDETGKDKGERGGDVGAGQKKRKKQGGRAGADDATKRKSKLDRDSADADDQNGTVPGGFDTAARAPLAGTASEPARPQKKKKTKKKAQGKVRGGEVEDGAGERRAVVGRAVAGDSTDADASVSLSLAVSGSTARTPGKEALRADTRPVPPARDQAHGHAPCQAREVLGSLSLDTDGSWTHIDRRRLKTSRTTDGQITRPVDAVDATSSDLASMESNSPVDRNESDASDLRGIHADPARATLTERLVPRPEEKTVDDMLEQPNVPTLARVVRVHSWADETPVPGFSWDDYGAVEDSVLVHDADQEDEGEWGIVKSRSRTRPPQTQTQATGAMAVPTSQVAATSEGTTKKQRQNARKRELAKAVKAEQETARLEGLEKHKRELEQLRIIERSRQGGKQLSGGMRATVDDRGNLVWE